MPTAVRNPLVTRPKWEYEVDVSFMYSDGQLQTAEVVLWRTRDDDPFIVEIASIGPDAKLIWTTPPGNPHWRKLRPSTLSMPAQLFKTLAASIKEKP